ncbi:hypothetical protein ACFQPG_03235 [Sphingomonas sp. GCM10030256]|uniref:hypothetical protein n=1 Tax=Sphingomonas sp. GCM10030256 TaxID=3273427 RepID=UPI003608B9F0
MDWMIATPPDTAVRSGPRPWWETRAFVAAMVVLSIVPLLYPPLPPLVDLFGHMLRYRVELDGDSPPLSRYYEFKWVLAGNLGVDLLIYPLAKLIGLEPAAKLIVLTIPPMTVAGMLWVAREVHYRLPPTVMFALPFAYGHHFLFGFVNYALAMAFAFLAFGLWLRLGRLGKSKLRAAIFVPISILVWLTHAFGWGMLGLLCFAAEAVRQHDRGRGWIMSAPRAAFHCLSLSVPVLLMLLWREGAGGLTQDWFNWKGKGKWFEMALRDRWRNYDRTMVGIAGAVFLLAIVHPRLTLSRMLFFTMLVLGAAFVVLPRIIFGSAYADMRLVPFLIAVGLLAIRFKGPTPPRFGQWLAYGALAFLLVRTATVTASLAIAANDQREKLAALDRVPKGARVVTLVGISCADRGWPLWRNAHLGGFVTIRRHGFSNNHWTVEGAKLLTVRYAPAGLFSNDPSQLVRDPRCRLNPTPVNIALAAVPRRAFDYLWLLDPPPFNPALLAGAEPVWRGNNRSALYRLHPAQANRPAP